MSTTITPIGKVYVFGSDRMFLDRGRASLVEPFKVKVHDVRWEGSANFMGAPSWSYSRLDDPTGERYVTHYDWALIEDNPENIQRLDEANAVAAESLRLRKEHRRLLRKVTKVRPPDKEAQDGPAS